MTIHAKPPCPVCIIPIPTIILTFYSTPVLGPIRPQPQGHGDTHDRIHTPWCRYMYTYFSCLSGSGLNAHGCCGSLQKDCHGICGTRVPIFRVLCLVGHIMPYGTPLAGVHFVSQDEGIELVLCSYPVGGGVRCAVPARRRPAPGIRRRHVRVRECGGVRGARVCCSPLDGRVPLRKHACRRAEQHHDRAPHPEQPP